MRRIHLRFPAAVRLASILFLLLLIEPFSSGEQIRRWLAEAERAALAGYYDRAVQLIDQTLRADGPQPAYYERLVAWSLAAGRYDDARLYLYTLADLQGWDAARRDQLQHILEQTGDTAPAEALFYAALADRPGDPDSLRFVARQQIDHADWLAAQETLARLLTLIPSDPEAAYLMGLLLAPTDQTEAAQYLSLAAAEEAWSARAGAVLDALPVYRTAPPTDAHTYLGITLVRLEEWPLAERAFQLALDANSVNSTALAYRGFVRDRRGGDGLPDIQAALDMAPTDPTLHYLLGLHWRRVGDLNAAHTAFERAYALAPANPALAAEVGASFQALDELVEAEEWLGLAVELEPDNPAWRRLLAAFYADTGFLLQQGGLTFIEEASQLAPDDPDIRTSLGWAYYRTGDIEAAYAELNRALATDPTSPRTRYYFGVVLERRGDVEGAADSFWYVVDQVGSDDGFGLLASRALRRLGYASS